VKALCRALGLIVASFALVLGLGGLSPASAALPFVVCDSFPAPSISGSAGVLTMHYFHSCNTIAGVTGMTGQLRLNGPDTGTFLVVSVPQGTAQSIRTHTIGATHGHWSVTETLEITGNFTTGPAPHGGCGRISPSTVFCSWTSTTIFA
jgi:hypothetical protein